MTRLFDAHCHIAADSADSAEAPPAPSSGSPGSAVAGRLLCGVDPADWDAITRAKAIWPGTRAAYGLHPWHVAGTDPSWARLLEERLAGDPEAWLGEAGLDWLKADPAVSGRAGREAQTDAFRRQLRLARRLGRPVNLHCVKAWDDLLAALDADYLDDGQARPFIVHAFGGPHQFITPLARRGAYFTVGPLLSTHDSPRQRARAALLPEDRLLLESDQFLVPGRDDAEGLAATLAWLAAARQADAAALEKTIADNAGRLFGDG